MKAPVIALLALIASGAGAQSAEDLPRALLIEAELVGGYTPLEMEKWTGTTPTASSQTSYGVNVRAYLLHIGKVRVGLQAGNQHFFKWERRTSFGSTTIVDRNTVAGFSVGIAVRA